MGLRNYGEKIAEELAQTMGSLSDEQGEKMVQQILCSKKIFVAGAGRSGFAARSFAMRLMHMGMDAFVAGETITPNITSEDMLIIGSGSGATESLAVMAKKAKSIGAKVGLVTILGNSPIGQIADVIITIPAPTPKIEKDTGFKSIQPMGSLFEQSLLLTFDAVILMLMDRSTKDSSTMFTRHANLE